MNEGVSEESEFKFTLYKNDLILIKDALTKEAQNIPIRFQK